MDGYKVPLDTWPWEVAVQIQPSRFDTALTVHDSTLVDPIVLDTSSQKAILVFDWDIHWNRNLLPPDFDSANRCFLAIRIGDVIGTDSSGRLAVVPSDAQLTNIVMGMSVVEIEHGYRTTLQVLERPDFTVDHLGDLEVLCISAAGIRVPLRLCASA